MAEILSTLDQARKLSFKQAVLAFSANGDYASTTIMSAFSAIKLWQKRVTSDVVWVAQALELSSVKNHISTIRNFFVFWKARDPDAISDDALQLLVKSQVVNDHHSNVLSDDPEKSWLRDKEYEALLISVWRHYEPPSGNHPVTVTFFENVSPWLKRQSPFD